MRPCGDDQFDGMAIYAQEKANECGAVCAVNIKSILYKQSFDANKIRAVKLAINPDIDDEGCYTSQILKGLAADPHKISCELEKNLAVALNKTNSDCIAIVKYKNNSGKTMSADYHYIAAFRSADKLIILDPLAGKAEEKYTEQLYSYGTWHYDLSDQFTTCVLCRKGEGVIAFDDFEDLLALK